MSELLKFRVVTVMSLLMVLAASSALPSTTVAVGDAEPMDVHPGEESMGARTRTKLRLVTKSVLRVSLPPVRA